MLGATWLKVNKKDYKVVDMERKVHTVLLWRCFKPSGARKAGDSTTVSPTSQLFDNESIKIKK